MTGVQTCALPIYKLVIKVVETKTRTMIDKCLELTTYDAQYRIPWIVFDRDQVQGYNANIFKVPADSSPKGISAISSESIFL